MKKTEKKIYDFVKKKLEEAEARKSSEEWISDKVIYGLDKKIEAYKEVLNFISAEPKIVGTTTVSKALEKVLLDNCPEVKKKLEAFEIIKKSISDKISLELLLREALRYGKITLDEFNLLKEVLE